MTHSEMTAWLREEAKCLCPEKRHYYGGNDTPCYLCSNTGIVIDRRFTDVADLIESQAGMMQEWREKAELLDWLLQHGYAVYSEYPETGERFTPQCRRKGRDEETTGFNRSNAFLWMLIEY